MSTEPEFIETIRITDGRFERMELHMERMARTMGEVYAEVRLPVLSDGTVPYGLRRGIVKCRILYGREVRRIEFLPYRAAAVRSLKVVDGTGIDYARKYADRSPLDGLSARKEGCDGVLIAVNGRITDTGYSNVVLFDGRDYYTPDTFLLNGTRRRSLLASGHIREIPLSVDDLPSFRQLFLINAMIGLGECAGIDVRNIYR